MVTMNEKPLLVVLLLLLIALLAIESGCTYPVSSSVKPTPEIVYVTVTVLVTPTPLPLTTTSPLVDTTATPTAVVTSPYFYKDKETGKYYRQPPGYICTSFRPQWEYGPDGQSYLRCEDGI